MISALVFLIVGSGEPILVALLFLRARGAGVPIFDVEAAREADVLVGEVFNDVRVAWVLSASVLGAGGNVWDYSIGGGREGCLEGCSNARHSRALWATSAIIVACARVVGADVRVWWGPLLRIS